MPQSSFAVGIAAEVDLAPIHADDVPQKNRWECFSEHADGRDNTTLVLPCHHDCSY